MICPKCGHIFDKDKKVQDTAAYDMSKDMLDARSEKFREMFTRLLHSYKESNPYRIHRFLRATMHISDDYLYKLINENAKQAMKVKGNRLAYLEKIIEGNYD